MIRGILLLLIEMKLKSEDEKDCIAQTFLELSCECALYHISMRTLNVYCLAAYERNRG